jgi:hypothetical protein
LSATAQASAKAWKLAPREEIKYEIIASGRGKNQCTSSVQICRRFTTFAAFAFALKVEHLLSGEDLLRRGMEVQGGDSKNFLWKFVRFFITLGLKILRLSRLKVVFEADIIKGWC